MDPITLTSFNTSIFNLAEHVENSQHFLFFIVLLESLPGSHSDPLPSSLPPSIPSTVDQRGHLSRYALHRIFARMLPLVLLIHFGSHVEYDEAGRVVAGRASGAIVGGT